MARRALLTRVVRRRHTPVPLTGTTPPATLQAPSVPGLDVPRRRYRFRGDGRARAVEFNRADMPRTEVRPEALPPVEIPRVDAATPAESSDEPVPHTIPLLPGEKTLGRRIKFGVANGCTVSSLMLGMSAIFLSMHGDARIAAALLVGCVVFDGLDGALARKMGVASPFGAQMDSLADMCSFGLAAPVVVYAWLHGRAPAGLIAVACGMIAAGAAIRLARFNVSPKDGRYFCGVPTTMTAAVMGLSVLIGLHLPGAVAIVALVGLAVAMVSGFPYAKIGRIARLPIWLWVVPIAGMLLDFQATFAVIVAGYLVSGPLLWLHQRNAVHRNRISAA
jgi:CDP-diacylglycerol---serine O-phosphatidyltransferase